MTISAARQSRVTVPLAKSIPAGTLAALVKDVAVQLETTVDDILRRLP